MNNIIAKIVANTKYMLSQIREIIFSTWYGKTDIRPDNIWFPIAPIMEKSNNNTIPIINCSKILI